jgi:transposase
MATIQLPILPPDLDISSILSTENGYILVACLTAKHTICPSYKNLSTKIHSCYTRHPADLPLTAMDVYFQLRIRRFRCTNPTCPKQTFSEPCAKWLLPLC